VTDPIDQIEEMRASFGDLIGTLAQRDRELQAEEPLFADGMLIAMMNIRGGVMMLCRQIGVPESTLRSWRDQINRDPNRRPMSLRSMRADRRTLISREELALLRQKLRETTQMEEGITTAMDFAMGCGRGGRRDTREERGPGVA
jgi:transposase-like protein